MQALFLASQFKIAAAAVRQPRKKSSKINPLFFLPFFTSSGWKGRFFAGLCNTYTLSFVGHIVLYTAVIFAVYSELALELLVNSRLNFLCEHFCGRRATDRSVQLGRAWWWWWGEG